MKLLVVAFLSILTMPLYALDFEKIDVGLVLGNGGEMDGKLKTYLGSSFQETVDFDSLGDEDMRVTFGAFAQTDFALNDKFRWGLGVKLLSYGTEWADDNNIDKDVMMVYDVFGKYHLENISDREYKFYLKLPISLSYTFFDDDWEDAFLKQNWKSAELSSDLSIGYGLFFGGVYKMEKDFDLVGEAGYMFYGADFEAKGDYQAQGGTSSARTEFDGGFGQFMVNVGVKVAAF